ncbi:hypothetical protein B0T20DRAFT_472282 [Sordaria brevicollis]|uniref:Uncharacterized protein n=1 Tax=Sordaria brevicollis TaxID=83679 RepID=A0AAE0P3E3_SORBR|nr:hypothetical protein B0T20DRAFT_472282 [Sordaria brevicollis]
MSPINENQISKKRKKNKYPMLGPRRKRRRQSIKPQHPELPDPIPLEPEAPVACETEPPKPQHQHTAWERHSPRPHHTSHEPTSSQQEDDPTESLLALFTQWTLEPESDPEPEPEPEHTPEPMELDLLPRIVYPPPRPCPPSRYPPPPSRTQIPPDYSKGGKLTLDKMPYDILYLIIQELCKPIAPFLGSTIIPDWMQGHEYSRAMGGTRGVYLWKYGKGGAPPPDVPRRGSQSWKKWQEAQEDDFHLAVQQLCRMPSVCRAFYEPATALIHGLLPLKFSDWRSWQRLEERGNLPMDRGLLKQIQRLHIDINLVLQKFFDLRIKNPRPISRHTLRHLDDSRRGILIFIGMFPPLLPNLRGLREIEIGISGERYYPYESTCETEGQVFESLNKVLTSRLDNLTTLRLKACASVMPSLLRRASFNAYLYENIKSCYLALSDDPQHPPFSHENNPTDAINAFVRLCQKLENLTLPYLSKDLRLHPNNAGLRELVAFEWPAHQDKSCLVGLYLNLFPMLMSERTARIELWNKDSAFHEEIWHAELAKRLGYEINVIKSWDAPGTVGAVLKKR